MGTIASFTIGFGGGGGGGVTTTGALTTRGDGLTSLVLKPKELFPPDMKEVAFLTKVF